VTQDTRASILVVDDEPAIRESLRMILEFEGFEVAEARHGAEALAMLAERAPDAVILDVKMPEIDGLGVLSAMRERGLDLPVLVVSGHGDMSTAVEAARRGAYDFLEKPLQRDRLLISLRNALEAGRLRRENLAQRQEPDEMVGDSAPMRRLRSTIERAAPTTSTVLITGESGTGKELVARAIHRGSPRATRAYVQVNCAAIPEELIESELFGHEKGSFTGAVRKQIGKFLAAHGGTIFLDEIGDMSARTQAKVLRVLQSGEVEPVGSEKVVRVDVRVVAATNRDLERDIADGRFREDLFYRLNVIPLRTPALRERAADIPALVDYFARRFGSALPGRPRRFDREAVEQLQALPWRGNVRELRNFLERLMVLAAGDVITRQDVVDAMGTGRSPMSEAALAARTLRQFREVSETAFIRHKLEENDWNVTQTASAIDTPRSNLYKKMEAYGIRRAGGAAVEPPSPGGDGAEPELGEGDDE
jgi:two-component system, NtrC family, nitrogen regulation response regulator NtrX